MENRLLVKFIRNYIPDSSGVFSISSLVRISMTSFSAFTLLFVRKYSCLCHKKKITRRLEDMNFIFSWQKRYFTHSLRSFLKYCFYHSKIKLISSRRRVISSMYPSIHGCLNGTSMGETLNYHIVAMESSYITIISW